MIIPTLSPLNLNQLIGLREKIQQNNAYFMGKSMVSCRFSLKPQPLKPQPLTRLKRLASRPRPSELCSNAGLSALARARRWRRAVQVRSHGDATGLAAGQR